MNQCHESAIPPMRPSESAHCLERGFGERGYESLLQEDQRKCAVFNSVCNILNSCVFKKTKIAILKFQITLKKVPKVKKHEPTKNIQTLNVAYKTFQGLTAALSVSPPALPNYLQCLELFR